MKTVLILLIFLVLIYGCATTHGERINKVELGMSKSEVLDLMGSPSSVSAKRNVEYYKYDIGVSQVLSDPKGASYFIRFIDGKVESYGEVGDFDSVKEPMIRIESNP